MEMPLTMTPSGVSTSADVSSLLLDAEKEMLSLIGKGVPLQRVLDVLCRTVEGHLSGAALTSVLLLEGTRLRHGAGPSLPEPYNAAIDGIEIGPRVGSCGTAAYSGKVVIVDDVATNPLWAAFADLATSHGLRACWSTPIFGTGDSILGTFAIYHRTPRSPSAEDLKLIDRVAIIARVAIEKYHADRERAQLVEVARSAQRESEAQRGTLREFIMEAPAILCMMSGPDHVIELANPRYLDLVGRRDIIGKPVRAALPEIEGQGYFELLDGVFSTGQPFVGREMRAEIEDGTGGRRAGYFDFVYQPTRGADGKIRGIAVYANEVTEFVEARQKLADALDREKHLRAMAEDSEARFRAMFDSMPQLGWTARPDGFIEFYNRGWYEYTGTTYEEMQGWGWKSVHDPDMLPLVTERWQESLRTGTPFEMEFPLRRHDGVFRWFLTRVNPVRDAKGDITRWVGINTDVDDLRAARALGEEVAAQGQQTARLIQELRDAKDAAERRLASALAGRA